MSDENVEIVRSYFQGTADPLGRLLRRVVDARQSERMRLAQTPCLVLP